MGFNAINRLGLLGAGNMAEALVRGMLGAGLLSTDSILAADPDPARRACFQGLGAGVTEDNREAAACATVLLAVKPQQAIAVLDEVGAATGANTLLVSIAAGLRTGKLAGRLPAGVRIVRVMPNTPMLVGAGVSCVAGGANATAEDVAAVTEMFSAAGEAYAVDEAMLDAVTAVSGSGPAYVFRLTEALAAAGEAAALPADLAAALARGTVWGAAKLMHESGEAATALRRKVTSPGGTTAAALASLDEDGFEATMQRAVERACARSRELASAG